jgi:hypothetical protein
MGGGVEYAEACDGRGGKMTVEDMRYLLESVEECLEADNTAPLYLLLDAIIQWIEEQEACQ